MRGRTFSRPQAMAAALALVVALTAFVAPAGPATAQEPSVQQASQPCSSAGTWIEGELNVIVFDVEQGDAQLLIGPTGRTVLIDLGERAWNSTSGTMAQRVAPMIKAICGVDGPVHLDYVMASHLHLDHIGYAGNPNDSTAYGNGIYELLHPDKHNFTVGELITRDAGHWDDSLGDGDGNCDIGTSAEPSSEVVFHNAGTVSQTARRWICWTMGPDGQHDRANIEGRVHVPDGSPWPALDLGAGVDARVVQADAEGVMQADGVTPVQGDHTASALPPSENDYSIAVRTAYGDYVYATAGDLDGEYATSGFNYTYNDVESSVIDDFGDVETMRVNHHGSAHSSSLAYVDGLAPETAVIQCGTNSYGHPANRVLDALRNVVNTDGVGADVYLTNNPCDDADAEGPIDYGGTFNQNGNIWIHTTDGGTGYEVVYDVGQNAYPAHPDGDDPPPDPEPVDAVMISESRFRGSGGAGDEFVEIHNAGAGTVDVSGWALQGCAGTTGAASNRAIVPAGTVLDPGQHWLFAYAGYTGGTAPDQTYGSGISDTGGARIVDAAGMVVDGIGSDATAASDCREGVGLSFPTGDDDVSFHRDGDGTVDTDDNVADFVGPAASTPQNHGGDTVGSETLAVVAAGYKVQGVKHADLTWTGATSTEVDIHVDGALWATTGNDGAQTWADGAKGGGSHAFQVCETGTSICSGTEVVQY